ncbi:MAG TPA: winged helix-turn-helix domain-containing protein [Natronosporangium sp.]
MVKIRRLATEAEAKALASAFRLRILRACLDESLTNQEIANRLGANPATTLHHVRTLVATGFLAPGPPRRGRRGSREIPYRATGKSWELRVDDTAPTNEAMINAFLEEYQFVEDKRRVWMCRLAARLTDAEYEELNHRINAIFEELAARPPSPDGRPYSFFYAAHPDHVREVTPPAAS